MKPQKPRSWLIYGLLGVLTLVTASGSVNADSSLRVKATVPFDFYLGNERLPAGDYSFRGHSRGQRVLIVNEVEEGDAVISLAQAAESPVPRKGAALIFRRYGDQYFLYQVWTTGWVSGYELGKSRTERSVEKDFAQSHALSKGVRDEVRNVEFVTITDSPN